VDLPNQHRLNKYGKVHTRNILANMFQIPASCYWQEHLFKMFNTYWENIDRFI